MRNSSIRRREILRFLVGGGSAVVVDFLVYTGLSAVWSPSPSKAVSYVAGAAVGFLINKFWTFESKRFRLSEVGRYVVLYATSALANTLVNRVVLTLTVSTLFAFLCATGVSTILNFLGQKFFVFCKGGDV